jgi:hypothetical protein
MIYFIMFLGMQKKIIIVCGLLVVCLMSQAFAQSQRATNLGDIVLAFCSDPSSTTGTKTALFNTEPEKESDICMLISNGGPTNTTIALNFVDGTITADEDQKKACEPETTKVNFGQYITDYPTTVQIQAGETIKIWAKAKFPAGYAGTAYGCTTFQIVDSWSTSTSWDTNKMFTIVTRRASFIDFNVKGEYKVDLRAQDASMEGSFPWLHSKDVSIVDSLLVGWNNIADVIAQKNPFAVRIGKNLITRSVLVNSGNVWLDLTISSHYRAWFGLLDLDQGSQEQKLVPRQRKSVEFLVQPLARWLGGPVTVTHTITYKPIIVGSGGILDPKFLQPQTKVLTSSGFVTAWNGWGIIGWLFIVICWCAAYLINRTMRCKHKPSRKSFK